VGRLLDAPQRPAQPSQSLDLLSLPIIQDVGYAHGAYKPPLRVNVPDATLVGREVIISGRFWVIAEGPRSGVIGSHPPVAAATLSNCNSDPLIAASNSVKQSWTDTCSPRQPSSPIVPKKQCLVLAIFASYGTSEHPASRSMSCVLR
jgi:hypothetical protein